MLLLLFLVALVVAALFFFRNGSNLATHTNSNGQAKQADKKERYQKSSKVTRTSGTTGTPLFPYSNSSNLEDTTDRSVLQAHSKLLLLSRGVIPPEEQNSAHVRPSFHLLRFLDRDSITALQCAGYNAWSKFEIMDVHALLPGISTRHLGNDSSLEQALKLLPVVTKAKSATDRAGAAAYALYCRLLSFSLKRRRPDYAVRFLALIESAIQSTPAHHKGGNGVDQEQRIWRQRLSVMRDATYRALAHAGMANEAERGLRRMFSSPSEPRANLQALSSETFCAVLYAVLMSDVEDESVGNVESVSKPSNATKKKKGGIGGKGNNLTPKAMHAVVAELAKGGRVLSARRALSLAQAAVGDASSMGGKSARSRKRGSRSNSTTLIPGPSPASAPLFVLIASAFSSHHTYMLAKSELLRTAACAKDETLSMTNQIREPSLSSNGVTKTRVVQRQRRQQQQNVKNCSAKSALPPRKKEYVKEKPIFLKSRANSDKTDRKAKADTHDNRRTSTSSSRHVVHSKQGQQRSTAAYGLPAGNSAWKSPAAAVAISANKTPLRAHQRHELARHASESSARRTAANRTNTIASASTASFTKMHKWGQPQSASNGGTVRSPPPGFNGDPPPIRGFPSVTKRHSSDTALRETTRTHSKSDDDTTASLFGAEEVKSKPVENGRSGLWGDNRIDAGVDTLLAQLGVGEPGDRDVIPSMAKSEKSSSSVESTSGLHFNERFEFGLPLWQHGGAAKNGSTSEDKRQGVVGQRPTSKSFDGVDLNAGGAGAGDEEADYSDLRATAKPFRPALPTADTNQSELNVETGVRTTAARGTTALSAPLAGESGASSGTDISLLHPLTFDNAWPGSSDATTNKGTKSRGSQRSPSARLGEGEDEFLGGALDLSFLN